MLYVNHYNKLIDRARNRLLEGYCERHHIVPRCMGGDDSSENLVRLTAEEHYVAHQLLVKMHPNEPKLIFAAHKMTSDPHGHRSRNKLYSWLRQQHSAAMSEMMLGVRRGPHTELTKQKISESKTQFYIDNPEKTTKGLKLPPLSDEHKKQISLRFKGHTHSEEHIRKNSEAHKGQVPWCKGKKRPSLSSETKVKISNSLKGGKATEATKLKMSKTRKGRPWSVARRNAYEETANGR